MGKTRRGSPSDWLKSLKDKAWSLSFMWYWLGISLCSRIGSLWIFLFMRMILVWVYWWFGTGSESKSRLTLEINKCRLCIWKGKWRPVRSRARRLLDNTGLGISVKGHEKSGRVVDRAYPWPKVDLTIFTKTYIMYYYLSSRLENKKENVRRKFQKNPTKMGGSLAF